MCVCTACSSSAGFVPFLLILNRIVFHVGTKTLRYNAENSSFKMTTNMRIQCLRESRNETSSRTSLFARENLSRSLTTQANKIAPRNVIQDGHGFWILRRGSWISDSLSGELIFGIPIVRGIPGSLSWIPDSKAQDSRIPRASLRTLLREIKIPKSKISNPKKFFDHPCHMKSGIYTE